MGFRECAHTNPVQASRRRTDPETGTGEASQRYPGATKAPYFDTVQLFIRTLSEESGIDGGPPQQPSILM